MPHNWQDQLDVDPHPDGVTIRRKRRPGDVLEDGEGIRVPALLMDSDPPDRPVYGRFSPEGFSAWAARGAALQDAWKGDAQIYEEALQELRELRHETDSGISAPPVQRPGYVRDQPSYDTARIVSDVDGAHYRREADRAWEERGRQIRDAWRTP